MGCGRGIDDGGTDSVKSLNDRLIGRVGSQCGLEIFEGLVQVPFAKPDESHAFVRTSVPGGTRIIASSPLAPVMFLPLP